MSVLEVRDVSIRFGGLQALQDINLEVNEYEIVGLIGPNGAGKTTAFNCITGFYTADTGTVTYRGKDVTAVPPHVKAAMGFGRTFQNVGMVKSATALENLKTAQHAKVRYDVLSGLVGVSRSWREERVLAERADQILEMLGLQGIRDTKVGGLSYGTLKLLELGCALATDPDVLLLDEPTSGMGPEESDRLGERLVDLRREFGLTMLLIEHHVPLVLAVCDHVYVLNFGRLLAEGTPEVIQTHPEVVAAYLGGEAPEALEQTRETPEDAELDAQLEDVVHSRHGGTHGEPSDPPTVDLPTVPSSGGRGNVRVVEDGDPVPRPRPRRRTAAESRVEAAGGRAEGAPARPRRAQADGATGARPSPRTRRPRKDDSQ